MWRRAFCRGSGSHEEEPSIQAGSYTLRSIARASLKSQTGLWRLSRAERVPLGSRFSLYELTEARRLRKESGCLQKVLQRRHVLLYSLTALNGLGRYVSAQNRADRYSGFVTQIPRSRRPPLPTSKLLHISSC